MIEGWHGDDYLLLFDDAEACEFSARYDFGKYLAGYVLVGLRGWDDFIVKGADGRFETVPTVPIDAAFLAPLDFSIDASRIVSDDRYRGKVKWYRNPLVFGGSPTDKDNMVWVPLEAHVDLVKFWNACYQRLKGPPASGS